MNRIDLCKEWKQEKTKDGIRFVFPVSKGACVRHYGFDIASDAAADVMRWYGFRFQVATSEPKSELAVTAGFYGGWQVDAQLYLEEEGEHTFDLSF